MVDEQSQLKFKPELASAKSYKSLKKQSNLANEEA